MRGGIRDKNTYSQTVARRKSSNTQSPMASNRLFVLGIIAFIVSFLLSLILTWWDFGRAFATAFFTVPATYVAAFFVDNRRRNNEMFILKSLHRQIKELEGVKSRVAGELSQIEVQHNSLYKELRTLQTQISESRLQRESINRELNAIFLHKKQVEGELKNLVTENKSLEQTQVELNNNFTALNSEKRRIEINCSVLKADIIQLQNQINEFLQEKQGLENEVILLQRLKPQLEEKLHELRVDIQELENQENQYHQSIAEKSQQIESLSSKKSKLENFIADYNHIKKEIPEKQAELINLQQQTSLLQSERDILQNQVWELLRELETLAPESTLENSAEENENLYPFADLMSMLEDDVDIDIRPSKSSPQASPSLPTEWIDFIKQLAGYEFQVLRAVLMQNNTQGVIKEIAEANITMPNILIDSINEKANDIIGDLIIDTTTEPPTIVHEYISNVRKSLEIHQKSVGV
jgi:myosin heavy subunit